MNEPKYMPALTSQGHEECLWGLRLLLFAIVIPCVNVHVPATHTTDFLLYLRQKVA